MAGEGPVEEGEGPSGGRFGGPRTQLKRRMALAQYMLHQVRCSRQAYYPETGKKGGPQEGSPGGSQGDGTGDSAADIAAAGAEGLADALDPSVPVSALLTTIPTSPSAAADAGGTSPHLTAAGEAAEGAAAAAVPGPSWGVLARETVAAAGRPPHEALELYLCERLLPLLDSALAALCSFVEQLDADERQYKQSLQQQQQQRSQQQQPEAAQDQRAGGPCLFLGQGLRDRFDPLVWLAQYLLRQGNAAEAYERASGLWGTAVAATTAATAAKTERPWVRGEHIRHSELPFYLSVTAQVREERGWRALEALKTQTERFLYRYLKELQQQEEEEGEQDEGEGPCQKQGQQQAEQQQEQQQQQAECEEERCPLTAEDLPVVLQALDKLWGLGEEQGLFAAVAAEEEETDTEAGSLPSSSRGGRLSARQLHMHPRSSRRSSNSSSSNGGDNSYGSIVGACSGVPLEVADSSNITFAELWSFVSACLQACAPLRQAVFAYALKAASSSTTQPQQQQQEGEEETQQQQQEEIVEQQQEQPDVLQQKEIREQQQERQQQQQETEEGQQPHTASLSSRVGSNSEIENSEEQQQQEQHQQQ